MNRNLLALAAVAALAVGAQAQAFTTTASFDVTLTVQNSCTLAVSNIVFAASNLIVAPTASGSATVTCTATGPVNIAVNGGTGGGTTAGRIMKNGASSLNYNLYRNAANTQLLGTIIGTDTIDFTSTGGNAADVRTIYATVPAGQNVPTGNYSDTLVATLTY